MPQNLKTDNEARAGEARAGSTTDTHVARNGASASTGHAVDLSAPRAGVQAPGGSPARPRPPGPSSRPVVRGKFLFRGAEKLYVKGVSYGPLSPTAEGEQFDRATAARDFAAMGAGGINAIRVYDVPPRWLLDLAQEHGLLVMVGLPWEQHVAFLKGRRTRRSIEQRVRLGVRACAGHPAVLAYAIGNEIPAPIVRWHGRRRIERFLRRLYRAAKQEDPAGLVTYVNYPSTEYLQLDFADLVCFNVYLERRDRLEVYLARLQNVADERPLLMAEIGLDSRSHGEARQAESLDWQVRAAFAAGCAGAFVFSWTDEWHRGGHDILDWDFGLTTRERAPKPALAAVGKAFAEAPLRLRSAAPSVSVIVCTYNGARTLEDCLSGLAQVEYPDYEVIVVSDGSTDASAEIARRHDVRVVETENRGLACARNVGLSLAQGELVAYLDDDARPDPQWLTYLAEHFQTRDDAGVGGPNVPVVEDGPVAHGVANAPGGPTHVLLDDRHAEHIPGCNMAFRRSALEELGGFDPRFHAAGDDVDLCWRVLDRGWTLGFCPGAVVWHHRRDTVRAYWRQQRGYGRAEAMLERKWPEKYSAGGHVAWAGRMYGNGSAQHHGGGRWRVYYGAWGSGAFQSIYQPAAGGLLRVLPLMPEWYLVIGLLVMASALGALVWSPLLLAVPLGLAAVAALVFDAALGAVRASFPPQGRTRARMVRLRLLTAWLYLLQPLARLSGRVAEGLTPWRLRGRVRLTPPVPRHIWLWSETWKPPEQRVRELEARLRDQSAVVISGGDWDRWDLAVRAGALGSARIRMAIEEHGAGRQLVRLRWWPRAAPGVWIMVAILVAVAAAALHSGAPATAVAMLALGILIAARVLYECASASATVLAATAPERPPAGNAELAATPAAPAADAAGES
jgi:GT2 family glycosyltransferase